jgi:hypothetical protein
LEQLILLEVGLEVVEELVVDAQLPAAGTVLGGSEGHITLGSHREIPLKRILVLRFPDHQRHVSFPELLHLALLAHFRVEKLNVKSFSVELQIPCVFNFR